jgi:predicted RND superfamily exporter protein
VADFGLLAAGAFAAALVSVLLLLPVLIRLTERRQGRESTA